MTDEEKIGHLIKYANSETIVLAVWRKPKEMCEKITLGDVAAIINSQQAELEKCIRKTTAYEKTVELMTAQLKTANDVVDRIEAENNSLRAEVKRLKNRNVELFGERNQEHRKLKTAKSEAIKEFAERLKATPMRFLVEYVKYYDKPSIDKMVLFIDDNDIDNLVKEMVGDDK